MSTLNNLKKVKNQKRIKSDKRIMFKKKKIRNQRLKFKKFMNFNLQKFIFMKKLVFFGMKLTIELD